MTGPAQPADKKRALASGRDFSPNRLYRLSWHGHSLSTNGVPYEDAKIIARRLTSKGLGPIDVEEVQS